MLNILVLLLVIWVAYLIIKQYNPPAVLIIAGLILFSLAYFVNNTPIINQATNSTNLFIFDLWLLFDQVTNNRLAKLGLTLVSIAGVATYMNKIGASSSFIKATSKTIDKISNPYVLLYATLVVVFIMYIFITGATSLSLKLMGTLYPILRNAGISNKTACATIVIPTAWEYGPGQINAVLGAKVINVDIIDFVIYHQTPIQIAVLITIPLVNILWQKYLDKKDNYVIADNKGKYLHEINPSEKVDAPKYYALFPLIPLVLLIAFSPLFTSKYNVSIPVAMMVTISICIIIESLHYKSFKMALDNFSAWIDGTGKIFATVIILMISAEFFAKGLEQVGAINTLITYAEYFENQPYLIAIAFSLLILLIAFITGSGNAPVLAFVSLVPTLSAKFNLNPLIILVPILLAAGVGRTFSPVAGVIITIAGIANLNTIDLVKRTWLPVIASLIIAIVISVIRYS